MGWFVFNHALSLHEQACTFVDLKYDVIRSITKFSAKASKLG